MLAGPEAGGGEEFGRGVGAGVVEGNGGDGVLREGGERREDRREEREGAESSDEKAHGVR